jgi:hypothetical protein
MIVRGRLNAAGLPGFRRYLRGGGAPISAGRRSGRGGAAQRAGRGGAAGGAAMALTAAQISFARPVRRHGLRRAGQGGTRLTVSRTRWTGEKHHC